MSIPFDPGASGQSMSQLSNLTGIPSGQKPKKKTRRGGRGTGAKKFQSDPASHMDAASKALAAGDHATAKKHAFALVRSLHASHPASAGVAPKSGNFPGGLQSTGVSSVPSAMAAGSGSTFPKAGGHGIDAKSASASRLVKALHSGRK